MRRAIDIVTATLLWVAAVGGAIALAINVAAGVPSGALWASTAVAALGLAIRYRRRGRS